MDAIETIIFKIFESWKCGINSNKISWNEDDFDFIRFIKKFIEGSKIGMKIECKKVKNKICRFALDKIRKILVIYYQNIVRNNDIYIDFNDKLSSFKDT